MAPIRFALRLAFLFLLTGPLIAVRAAAPPEPTPTILVHVMPWYEGKRDNGRWGWHWTMNHFQPDRVQGKDRREIASHFYPEIGPYDSADPAVLDYQTLLMKVAGIDGVIIDWYGFDAVNDYPSIHQRTLVLVDAVKRRGLKFALCYEDRVVRTVAERDKLAPDQATERAATHLRFAADHWFTDPAYVQWDEKPLLMAFGPDYLTPPQWRTALGGLKPQPAFFTLHERKDPAVGSFAWPPMWASKNGKLAVTDLDAYLDRFARQPGAKIPCAFPGFHDIYAEAGERPTYGFLDAQDGETFQHTLDRALASKSPIVQVATWNDYGEGTGIEPTREFGTRYLAMIQGARRRLPGQGFPFGVDDLQLPGRIFDLLGRNAPGSRGREAIDAAVRAIDAGDPRQATIALDRLTPSPAPRAKGSSY